MTRKISQKTKTKNAEKIDKQTNKQTKTPKTNKTIFLTIGYIPSDSVCSLFLLNTQGVLFEINLKTLNGTDQTKKHYILLFFFFFYCYFILILHYFRCGKNATTQFKEQDRKLF